MVTAAVAATAAAPASAAKPSIIDDFGPDGVIDPCKHTTAQLRKELDVVGPDIAQYAADYPAAIEAALEARARGDCGGGPATSGTAGGGGGGGGGGAAPPATGGTPAAPDDSSTAPPAAAGAPAAPAATADPASTGGEVVAAPPAPAGATTPAPAGVPDAELARAAARTAGNDAPLPVLLLGVLAAAIALAVLTGAGMRRLGLAGDRFDPAAHAWREAAWRAGGTWADFRDWVRLGR